MGSLLGCLLALISPPSVLALDVDEQGAKDIQNNNRYKFRGLIV